MNLQGLNNKTILLFGKSRAFSDEEFEAQLRFHNISTCRDYSDEVALVVDGKMMTPYEQNESDALYEKHSKELEFVDIDTFEKELAKLIDEDTLLMSLKLSHDKARLKSFIQNATISDALFFKLVKMYKWSSEDFFENDDNRDVSAAFILRFYENIERNHNVQYATTGFLHLVKQTKDSDVLSAIALLEPMKFNPKIESAIAKSPYCSIEMQKRYAKVQKRSTLEALSLNENLFLDIAKEFLKDEKLALNVAKSIKLTEEIYEVFSDFKIGLALNNSLSEDMQKRLLSLDDDEISYALALNNKLHKDVVIQLLDSKNEDVKKAVYENPSTPVEFLQKVYDEKEYYLELSKNSSTPLEILQQLQLDSRYERYVMSNAGFGKYIQQENIGWLV
jgi:hypothetical protein